MESTPTLPLPLDADLLCGHCAQNLRGVSSDRCPECGHRFDRAHILGVQVPWEQRRHVGRFRAYWRTVRLVTFRAKTLTLADAITLRAARSFRRWTLLLLCLTAFSAIMMWKLNDSGPRPGSTTGIPLLDQIPKWPELPELARNPWVFGTSLVSLLLWIVTAAGIASCFFHPRRLSPAHQARAVALSCYAIAPLGWIPALALLAVLFLGLEIHYEDFTWIFYPAAAVFGTLLVLCALCPIAFWWVTLRLLYKATGSRRRTLIAAPLLPTLWVLSAAFIFLGLHFAVNYIPLFFASLR